MNPVSNYRRNTKPISLHAYIPAVATILVGVVVLTKIFLLGLFLILSAFFALSNREGLEIDFTKGQIRIFFSFFGFRFGKWEPLLVIERITFLNVNHTHSMLSQTNLTTEITVSYAQVRLYVQGSTDYYLASNGKFNSAQADVLWLSDKFGLTHEDYTVVRS